MTRRDPQSEWRHKTETATSPSFLYVLGELAKAFPNTTG